ncbi:MAG TPA: phosphate ABC transporter substrate-binding protein PstS [Gammaproteobacteria bacterium]|nr:phosphate ABC transporter substrate-binding protein PstS [Gammaproteobacteria bacterium]
MVETGGKSIAVMCVAWALAALPKAAAAAGDITGAGASFPYPLYAKWAEAYNQATGVRVNYQSLGSGGGIKQIEAGTVVFGASDEPLEPAELEANGLVQWPMVIGGVVPVVNLAGLAPGELLLDGPTLAAIYMGQIREWNDPRVARLNPDLALPDQVIAPVYRADGSGTTFLFTTYLSKVSPEFAATIGASTAVAWPLGLGAKGNEGAANMTARTGGAIGYVDYAYAQQSKMTYVRLENREGEPITPSIEAFQAAAASADWAHAPNYHLILVDQPGADSWPITGASFILMHGSVRNADAALTALKFFAWSYAEGDELAVDLYYIPLPDKIVQGVEQMWSTHIESGGKPLWSK